MKALFVSAGLLISGAAVAQLFPATNYPHDYFRNPLDVPIKLAANFGELRPNHYHMGLDIRTMQRENLPVHAAADGYVSRVEIEPAGFGQAIYIRHPNGYTTVYGHLNQFFPALAAYISEQQYKQQSWQVDLELPAGLFPVKKGDLIAYSGNTGGSQGPHLHFEIRRTAGDVNQNPLLFGLPVPDNTPPSIVRLAWYDRAEDSYEGKAHLLPVHKIGVPGHTAAGDALARYALTPDLLTVSAKRITFALSAFDTQSGSSNPNGIFQAVLYEDEQPVIGFQLNNISYDNTRNINAHIDYALRAMGGPFVQRLFLMPGYPAPTIYASPAGQPTTGVLDLGDGKVHRLRVEVKDTYGNTSLLEYQVKYDPSLSAAAGAPVTPPGKLFYPGMVDGIDTTGCSFFLGEKSLYDSVWLSATQVGLPGSGHSLSGGVSATYAIGAPWVPLLEPVLVRLSLLHDNRPNDALAVSGPTAINDHIVMVCTNGSQRDVQRVEWHDGWASARFRGFGNFQLVEDTIAPVITPLQPMEGAHLGLAPRIAFSVKDNLSGIRHFRAELDGAWLCFTNDKNLAYIYKFDSHCLPGRHTLTVTAEDVAGNKVFREYHFTR